MSRHPIKRAFTAIGLGGVVTGLAVGAMVAVGLVGLGISMALDWFASFGMPTPFAVLIAVAVVLWVAASVISNVDVGDDA